MEIPEIVSGISRFQNPSFLLYLKALSTWAALIIAAIAAFSSLIRRSKRLFLRIRRGRSVIPLPSTCSSYSSDGDDDDDESCRSSSDEESDGELTASSQSEDEDEDEEDFGDFEEIQGQNGDFEWSPEVARDGSVVKFWEWDRFDLHGEETLRFFSWKSGEIPAVHVAPQGTVAMAGREGEKSVGVRVWDARAAGGAPVAAASATWQGGRVVRVGGDCSEVYVGDEAGKLAVVDLRNVRSTSADSLSWCDDGTVTVGDGDRFAAWCRNAARCLTV